MRRLSTTAVAPATGRALPAALRRVVVAAAVVLCAGAVAFTASSRAAVAAPTATGVARTGTVGANGEVHVVSVSGLLDGVVADFVHKSLDQAEKGGAVALVLQLNSSGSVLSDHDLVDLAKRLHDASLPVAIWVGPSGAKARGEVGQLLGVVPIVGVAPGSTVGDLGRAVVPSRLQRVAYRTAEPRLRHSRVGSDEARRLGLATVEAPVIVDLVGGLPGVPSHVEPKPSPHRVADVTPVFSKLPPGSQLMHTVASPAAAYLLVVIGLALIVFELFTAGVGVAGLVGAACFSLGTYGLWVLPTDWAAYAGLLLAFVAFSVDVQTGVPRFWTGVGTVALLASSLLLFDGMAVPWLALAVGVVGTIAFMLSGMPAMVRTRFSTPTIGREWMVGAQGDAVAAVDPDGVVRIGGGLWRARTNRATPIPAGSGVRVVEVSGLVLEVEPLEGGAVDAGH